MAAGAVPRPQPGLCGLSPAAPGSRTSPPGAGGGGPRSSSCSAVFLIPSTNFSRRLLALCLLLLYFIALRERTAALPLAGCREVRLTAHLRHYHLPFFLSAVPYQAKPKKVKNRGGTPVRDGPGRGRFVGRARSGSPRDAAKGLRAAPEGEGGEAVTAGGEAGRSGGRAALPGRWRRCAARKYRGKLRRRRWGLDKQQRARGRRCRCCRRGE